MLLMEDQVDGFDIRAFVVGGRVAAATTRVNAHVVGDGRLSISALIAEKQVWRDQHAVLRKRSLTVEAAVLARAGRSIDDVPEAGEVVVLNSSSNLHTGGENVDITDLAHPGLLDLAVEVTRAIPGLGIAGVDLMARDIDSPDGAVVLEANVTANIRVHHYPAYGQSRDVAGAIVDAMIASTGAPARAPSPVRDVDKTDPSPGPSRAATPPPRQRVRRDDGPPPSGAGPSSDGPTCRRRWNRRTVRRPARRSPRRRMLRRPQPR